MFSEFNYHSVVRRSTICMRRGLHWSSKLFSAPTSCQQQRLGWRKWLKNLIKLVVQTGRTFPHRPVCTGEPATPSWSILGAELGCQNIRFNTPWGEITREWIMSSFSSVWLLRGLCFLLLKPVLPGGWSGSEVAVGGASLGHEGRGETEDPLLVWRMGAISQRVPGRPSKFLHWAELHILSGCFNIHGPPPNTHTPLYFSHPP